MWELELEEYAEVFAENGVDAEQASVLMAEHLGRADAPRAVRTYHKVASAQAAGYHYEELKGHRGYASKWPEKKDLLKAIRKLPSTYHETIHRKHRGLMDRAERFFGNWRKAVEAAGLEYQYEPPPIWPAEVLLKRIRRLRDKSLSANMHTRLYHAARTAFGSWRYAVELAGFPYFEVAQRFRWRHEEVLYYIRWLAERGKVLDPQSQPELYRYALKFFGSQRNAIHMAGMEPGSVHFKHKVKRTRETKSSPEIAREMAQW